MGALKIQKIFFIKHQRILPDVWKNKIIWEISSSSKVILCQIIEHKSSKGHMSIL